MPQQAGHRYENCRRQRHLPERKRREVWNVDADVISSVRYRHARDRDHRRSRGCPRPFFFCGSPQTTKLPQTEKQRYEPQQSDPRVRNRERDHPAGDANSDQGSDPEKLPDDDVPLLKRTVREEQSQQEQIVEIRYREKRDGDAEQADQVHAAGPESGATAAQALPRAFRIDKIRSPNSLVSHCCRRRVLSMVACRARTDSPRRQARRVRRFGGEA